jgi:murein L,D-transpeptidase YafK
VSLPFLKKRNTHRSGISRLGIALIIVLLLATASLFHLYMKTRDQNALYLKQVEETRKKLDQIQLSMGQGDLKKAFAELSQAQKSVAALLPPGPDSAEKPVIALNQPAATPPPSPAQEAKPPATAASAPLQTPAQTEPAKPQAPYSPAVLTLAADESPFPLVLADAGEYMLVCEKDGKTLHLFRYADGRFGHIKSYPCIVGANGLDKKKAGDLATPMGNYFFLRYIPGKSLPEKYGHGAFVLNYPNFLDRRDRKDGTGIWLHGHTPGKSIGQQELENTSGCIVIANGDLDELTGMLKANGTPIVVVNRLQPAKAVRQRQLSEELNRFMKSWSSAWESANTKKFMAHYAHDFVNGDGMNYQAFKRQKERVNIGKKFIRVKVENPAILLPQDRGGQVAIVRFTQRYRSNNYQNDSKKLFYLKKGQTGWQIIGESRL